MYIQLHAGHIIAASKTQAHGSDVLWVYDWIDNVSFALETFTLHILSILREWVTFVGETIREIVRDPSSWAAHALFVSYTFLRGHPHLVYLTCLSIFFGPIIVLIPFLLLHEIVVLALFNLSFISHGLLPGRVEDQYEELKERFVESRERLFSSVEAMTARFNQCTTDHRILLVTRIVAGVLGLYILYGIWGGWT